MGRYLFFFGRTPQLSFLELQTFFPSAVLISDDIALCDHDTSPETLMATLGGTVKIASVEAEVPDITIDSIAQLLQSTFTPGDKTFSLHIPQGYPDGRTQFFSQVKKRLADSGLSTRYVYPTDPCGVSSVVYTSQSVKEVHAIVHAGGFLYAKTIAVQDFRSWDHRDYGRPFADPKRGMLPPKVARMIVNIAKGFLPKTMNDTPITLCDPFCGMGTVLAEAILTGWRVMGSDTSLDAVTKSQKNLAWIHEQYPNGAQSSVAISLCDATHLSEKISPQSIDAIVTEPFMGDTQLLVQRHDTDMKPDEVKNIIKGLEKLYIGCLRNWHSVLKPSGVIVMALPKIHTRRNEYFVKKVIDTCENYGYTIETGPLEYSRPQAVVRREFYIFRKQ